MSLSRSITLFTFMCFSSIHLILVSKIISLKPQLNSIILCLIVHLKKTESFSRKLFFKIIKRKTSSWICIIEVILIPQWVLELVASKTRTYLDIMPKLNERNRRITLPLFLLLCALKYHQLNECVYQLIFEPRPRHLSIDHRKFSCLCFHVSNDHLHHGECF